MSLLWMDYEEEFERLVDVAHQLEVELVHPGSSS